MRVTRYIILAFYMSLLLLSSCSKDKKKIIVAEVGDRKVSLYTFERTYAAVDPEYLPKQTGLDGLKEFLDNIINKQVMAMKADELGYEKDPAVVQMVNRFKTIGLQAAYIKIRVADQLDLSDDILKKYYDLYDSSIMVKQILCDTEADAEQVYNLLQEGADFETVCKQYSKGPDADIGGEVQEIKFGTYQPSFQNATFGLQVGDVSHPIETGYGYFVVKLVGKKHRKKPPFEDIRDEVVDLARNTEERQMAWDLAVEVRKKYGFQWYEDNLRLAFAALPPDVPVVPVPPRSAEVYPLLKIEPMDLKKPLVSYRDKVITMEDFSDYYDKASHFIRPQRQYRLGGIKKFLLDIVMKELIPLELEESNIANEPEVAEVMRKKKEEFMVSKLYRDLVQDQTLVTYREIKEHYNEYKDHYRVPEERRFALVLTPDKASASEAYAKTMKGTRFEKIVAEYSMDQKSKENDGDTGFLSRGEQPELDETGFALKEIGDVSEPFEISRGWAVLKFLESKPERTLPLEEVENTIRRTLKSAKEEKRLNELLAKWKEDIPIKVYDKNLLKAKLERAPHKKRTDFGRA